MKPVDATRVSGERRECLATRQPIAMALFALCAALITARAAHAEETAPLMGEPAPAEPVAVPGSAEAPAAQPVAAQPLAGTVVASATMPSSAMSDTQSITATATAPVPPVVPGPPPPPYSLPWQLRPVTVGNVVRSDTATAFYKDAMGNTGSTVASMLLASYKVTPEIAPMVRLGFVKNDAPAAVADGNSFVNPIIGATYSHKMDTLRLAGFLATTIPIGMGAGNTPDAGSARADADGIKARSAMDNAMFAVNYMTGIAGLGLAYIDHGFTAQAEVTLLQLFRVRGDNAASATDSTRTNSTAALHLGYFVIPQLSFGGEIRYQRWLSHPTTRNAMTGAHVPLIDANMDTVTFAVGPRAHFKLSKTLWVRPGISYARGLDAPLTSASYNVVQVDVPVIF